jgi:hypothetical protein
VTPGDARLAGLPAELHNLAGYVRAARGAEAADPAASPDRHDAALRSTLLLSWGAIDACKRGDAAGLRSLSECAREAFAHVRRRWQVRFPGLDDARALARVYLGREDVARRRRPAFRNPRTPPPEALGARLDALAAAFGWIAELGGALPRGRSGSDGPFLREAAAAHIAFGEAHPFDDANGRVARLLLAWQLRAAGLEPPRWRVPDRIAYAAVFPERDVEALVRLVRGRVTMPGGAWGAASSHDPKSMNSRRA